MNIEMFVSIISLVISSISLGMQMSDRDKKKNGR